MKLDTPGVSIRDCECEDEARHGGDDASKDRSAGSAIERVFANHGLTLAKQVLRKENSIGFGHPRLKVKHVKIDHNPVESR